MTANPLWPSTYAARNEFLAMLSATNGEEGNFSGTTGNEESFLIKATSRHTLATDKIAGRPNDIVPVGQTQQNLWRHGYFGISVTTYYAALLAKEFYSSSHKGLP